MKSFSLADARHMTAAQGWLELGDWESANDELEEITATNRSHPQVLLLRCEIYGKAKRWDMVGPVIETLVDQLPDSWRVHYMFAKWLAATGKTESARAALERAFATSKNDIRIRALDDPDLARIWVAESDI